MAATPPDAPATVSERRRNGVARLTPGLLAIADATASPCVTGLLTSMLPTKRFAIQLSLALSAPALSALTPTAVATLTASPAAVIAVRLRARVRCAAPGIAPATKGESTAA